MYTSVFFWSHRNTTMKWSSNSSSFVVVVVVVVVVAFSRSSVLFIVFSFGVIEILR